MNIAQDPAKTNQQSMKKLIYRRCSALSLL